jgi:uncharacterized membrane protein YvbJ
MALIHCPECSTQVSNQAPTCPTCGSPIAGRIEASAAGANLTTTQATSKRFKLHIILASLCFWSGMIWMFSSIKTFQTGTVPETNALPSLLIVTGLFWYIGTKVRIWWHHK